MADLLFYAPHFSRLISADDACGVAFSHQSLLEPGTKRARDMRVMTSGGVACLPGAFYQCRVRDPFISVPDPWRNLPEAGILVIISRNLYANAVHPDIKQGEFNLRDTRKACGQETRNPTSPFVGFADNKEGISILTIIIRTITTSRYRLERNFAATRSIFTLLKIVYEVSFSRNGLAVHDSIGCRCSVHMTFDPALVTVAVTARPPWLLFPIRAIRKSTSCNMKHFSFCHLKNNSNVKQPLIINN